MNQNLAKLEWDEKYSVGVQLIDEQHKKMFEMINGLIEAIATTPTEEKLQPVIKNLLIYKKAHFATEEKYFHEFNYEGTAEHEEAHHFFDQKTQQLQKEFGSNVVVFTFELIDFLEDWLISHLMSLDRKYIPCFKEHGLK